MSALAAPALSWTVAAAEEADGDARRAIALRVVSAIFD